MSNFSNSSYVSTSYANEAKNQPMLWTHGRKDSRVISNESVLGFDLTGQESVNDAFKMADCDFSIVRTPTAFMGLDGYQEIEGVKTLVREDNYNRLAEVSDTYSVLQPADLMEFTRQILDMYKEARLTNLINFNKDKRMYAVLDLGTKQVTGPNDTVANRLHWFNSNDLSTSFGCMFTSQRLQCCNQLSSFTGRMFRDAKASGKGFSMKHSAGIQNYIKFLPNLINKEKSQFDGVINDLKELAKVKLTGEIGNKVIQEIYKEKLATPIYDHSIKDKRDRTIADLKELDTIRKHFKSGFAIEDTAFKNPENGKIIEPSNCYRFYNSISQYYTHDTGRVNAATNNILRTQQRLNSLYHGDNGKIINRTREVLMNSI